VDEARNEFKAAPEWQKQRCDEFASLVVKTESEKSMFLKSALTKEKIVFVILIKNICLLLILD
jgi:hypothetical protein